MKLKGPARAAPERKFNSENREERNNQRNRPEKPIGSSGGDFHRFVSIFLYWVEESNLWHHKL